MAAKTGYIIGGIVAALAAGGGGYYFASGPSKPASSVTQPSGQPPGQPPAADPVEVAFVAAIGQAEQAMSQGNLPEAEARLAEAERLRPNDPRIAQIRQRIAEARAAAEAAARRAEEERRRAEEERRLGEARALVQRALAAASAGDFAAAERLLNEAQVLAPNLPEIAQARAEIAQLRARLENERRAAAEAQRLAEARRLAQQALQEARAGNLDAAETLLRRAEALAPAAPEVRQARAEVNQIRAQRDTGARIQHARLLVEEARRFAAAGDFTTADAFLRQAETVAPGLPEIAQARAEIARLQAESEARLADAAALAAAIDDALARGDLFEAERLLNFAERRHPGVADWRALRTRLDQARAQADFQNRLAQARSLVAQARQAAAQGDFRAAERALFEASRLAPGLPEIAIARAEVARMRAERDRSFAELRAQIALVQAAQARGQFVEAERLIAEGEARFPGEPVWAQLRADGQRMRAESERAQRLAQVRGLIAQARAAANAGDFIRASQLLAQANALLPNHPEIAQANAAIGAQRAAAGNALATQIQAAIDAKNFPEAERLLVEANRRFPGEAVWATMRQRLDQAKAAAGAGEAQKLAQMRDLVAQARAAANAGDFIRANQLLAQANAILPNHPEIAQANAAIGAQRAAAGNALATQIQAAIDAKNFPEADRLLAEANRRFPGEAAWATLKTRLDAAKAAAGGDAQKLAQMRDLVAQARAAANTGDFIRANQLLAQANAILPNHPEIAQANAAIGAQRTAAGNALATQIQNAINAKNFPEAERLLAEANRRFPGEAVWGQLKARLDAAKAAAGGDAQKLAQMRDLVAQARAAANAGDFIRANQLLAQANAILPNHPEIAQANAAIGAQRTAAGNALATQIQNAINAKNFPEAERLLAEANRRFPSEAVWGQLKARLDAAKAAAGGDAQKLAQMRDLVAQARAAANAGDFIRANQLLAQANAILPNHPEIVQANAAIGAQRTAAGNALATQIQNAINAKNFPEAERLLAEANRRFPGETVWGQLKARLDAAKAAAGGDAQKLAQMRDLVAQARAAANAGDFIRANQLLAQANAILPNHPEIVQANAAIGAQRTAAGNALATQIQNAINAKNFPEAERLLAEANRRFPGEAVWGQLKARLDAAKAANPPPPPLTPEQARNLIGNLIAGNLQRDEPQLLAAYRAERATSRALAYCVLWPAVTRTSVPRGAAGGGVDRTNNDPAVGEKAALDACNAARTPAMGACQCVVLDRNGTLVFVVPPPVLQRLNQ